MTQRCTLSDLAAYERPRGKYLFRAWIRTDLGNEDIECWADTAEGAVLVSRGVRWCGYLTADDFVRIA